MSKVFNLVEIRENNMLQVRYLDTIKTEKANANRFHRTTVNSLSPNLSEMPELVQQLAAAFPAKLPDVSLLPPDLEPGQLLSAAETAEFISKIPDGVYEEVNMIRILADENKRSEIRYDVDVIVIEGDKVWTERKPPKIVTCFCDLSEHPEKVQKVAEIIFTDEVKAKARAGEDAKWKQKTVMVPTGETEEYEEEEIFIDTTEGKAVQRKRTVINQRSIMKEVGVVDEDGNPVMGRVG